ncbi:hypothetical protein B296_00035022 [Ensete ventricosum]|uniref:Uncharacterized protein n=1 Tax=Ensete ventricosum TaxID=4639 RepID=A0A426XNA6_ENSVE|nr:hypothetical protein B296_00035022 [Ensete ventricosum]
MDSVKKRHLEVLALHEKATVRSSTKGKPKLLRHGSGSLPGPSPWRLGPSRLLRGVCRALVPVGGGEVPSRTPPLPTSYSKLSSSSSAPSIWPSSPSQGLNAPVPTSSDPAGASGSSDNAAGSLPLDRERDSPSPGRDLCLLVSTLTFLWRLTASSAYSVGVTTGLFNEAFGASLAGEAPTSRAMGRVGGTLSLATLGIPHSSPIFIRSVSRPTVRGGVVDRVCRLVEPKPQNWTTNIKVAGLLTFVIGRCPVDSKTDPGGEVVTTPTLAKAKARHEQVPSRDNPDPSALAQKDDKVAPRVGHYLAGRDPPPPQAFFNEWMQRKSETGLQSIHRDAYAGSVQTIGALPGLRNMQPVFDRDVVPLLNHGKSLRTLALIGDGGPEDAPEEPTSGSHRLVSPDPGGETTLTLLEEFEEVIPTCSKKNYRLKGRWVARKVRDRSKEGAK